MIEKLYIRLILAVCAICLIIGLGLGLGLQNGSALIGSTIPSIFSTSTDKAFHLRVGLYPYIPNSLHDNFEKLCDILEIAFYDRYGINITIETPGLDNYFYDLDYLNRLIEKDYHILEIDSLLLGDLSNYLHPWEIPSSVLEKQSWPNDFNGQEYNGTNWGIPHWRCGYFTFTRNTQVHAAQNVNELSTALKNLTSTPKMLFSITNWDLVGMYIISMSQTFGPEYASEIFNVKQPSEFNQTIIENIASIIGTCENETFGLPCFNDDGTFIERFSNNQVSSFIGYLELLSFMKNTEDILINQLKLGTSDKTQLITDVFVKSKKLCNGAFNDVADKFAEFITSKSTYEMIVEGHDGASPRYVLPAFESAWDIPTYQRVINIKDSLARSVPIPTKGMYDSYLHLYPMLLEAIQNVKGISISPMYFDPTKNLFKNRYPK